MGIRPQGAGSWGGGCCRRKEAQAAWGGRSGRSVQGAGSGRLNAWRGSPAILWTVRDGLMTVSVIFVANERQLIGGA